MSSSQSKPAITHPFFLLPPLPPHQSFPIEGHPSHHQPAASPPKSNSSMTPSESQHPFSSRGTPRSRPPHLPRPTPSIRIPTTQQTLTRQLGNLLCMLQDPRWHFIVITREEKTAILLVLHRYISTGVPVNDEEWSNGDLTASASQEVGGKCWKE